MRSDLMKSPRTGEDITNHEYHHGEEWGPLISSTRFKAFYESPAAFRWPLPFTESSATDLGTAAHSAILDPDKIDDLVVLPDIPFRSTADKDLWRLWLSDFGADHDAIKNLKVKDDFIGLARNTASIAGKSVVSEDQLQSVRAMSISVLESSDACDALAGGLCEMSFRSGSFKARPDCISGALLSDLKTTGKFDRFNWQAYDLKYPSSLAWYERVLRECHVSIGAWAWIVVESNPYRLAADGIARHRVKVVVASEELCMESREALDDALTTYQSCVVSGEWPSAVIAIEELQSRGY